MKYDKRTIWIIIAIIIIAVGVYFYHRKQKRIEIKYDACISKCWSRYVSEPNKYKACKAECREEYGVE